jgi:hypothetical protein
MHMYAARKIALENREITSILKDEMSFATETRLGRLVVVCRVRLRLTTSFARLGLPCWHCAGDIVQFGRS